MTGAPTAPADIRDMAPHLRRAVTAAALTGALVGLLPAALSTPVAAQVAGAVTPQQEAVVVVDPRTCRETPATACTLASAVARLGDGGTLVLRAGVHAGALDLRGLDGVTVRGDRGAVVDAGRGRYALSLRDARQARITGLTLRGGTAQTVWVERTVDARLERLQVDGGAGAGVQLRDSRGVRLADSRITGAASAGLMELTGVHDAVYERLTVSRNGHGAAQYDGDGLQLSGTGTAVRDVVITDNGSSARYEHGVYVSARARDVLLSGVVVRGSSGTAVKLGGSGRLERSAVVDDGTALYCGQTVGAGWRVRATTVQAPTRTHAEAGCRWSLS